MTAAAMTTDDSRLRGALWYAHKLGWPVAPAHSIERDRRCTCGKPDCGSPGKHPRTVNGFKDATTDRETIEGWWQQWPGANVLIPTGEASGIWALDVDPAHGGSESLEKLEAEHGAIPATVEQITGSGGRHLLFRHSGPEFRNTAGKLGTGLDTRGEGGYVIVPPSNHICGVYGWREGREPWNAEIAEAPEWLLARLRQPKTPVSRPQGNCPHSRNAYAEAALAEEQRLVATAQPGSRNDQLNRSAFALGQLVGGGQLDQDRLERALTDAALAAGLGQTEIATTVASGLQAGMEKPRSVPITVANHGRQVERHQDRDVDHHQRGQGHESDWPEPDLSALAEGKRPPPELPVETFRHYWHHWLEAEAENRAAPIDYTAGGLLGSASALIGNSRWVTPWQGWKEPPVLWLAEVGDPSSNKSPAQDAVRDPLSLLEGELATGYGDRLRLWRTQAEEAKARRAKWEAEVKDAVKKGHAAPEMPQAAVDPEKPPRPRLVLTDTTPEEAARLAAAEPRGLLLHRDELAGFIGGFDRYGGAGAERAFWLEAYGGRRFVVDRVKSSGDPIIVPRLSISVLGGLTPDKLATALLAGDDDGFAARFLYMWPDPIPPRRPTRPADEQAIAMAFRRLRSLKMGQDENGGLCPVVVRLDDAAADAFDEWRQEHVREPGTGKLASHFGKMPGHVLRLALVMEFLWWSANVDKPEPKSISREAVVAAAALIEDYFKPMAERTFGDAALPERERLAATLAVWLIRQRPKKINARQVRREARLPGLREASKVNLAIEELVEHGWLSPGPSREGETPGRQKNDYVVNPKLWEALK
jgi:hypothetical protein